jgi:hypothetical protein
VRVRADNPCTDIAAPDRGARQAKVVAARMGVGASAPDLWVKAARQGNKASKPTFAKLVRASPPSSSIVLEVGRARVRVEAGFDAELLRPVVSALSDAS